MAFLTAGMIALWLTVFVFVFSVMRRQAKLDEQLEVLEASLPEAEQ